MKGIGAAAERLEDLRFITGHGRYTADIAVPGMLHGLFVRADIAHGRITGIDLDDALAVPGVVAILTGQDALADSLGTLKTVTPVRNRDGSPFHEAPRPVLPHDKVHHVGQPLALVIAETMAAARDAADLVVVEIAEDHAVIGIGVTAPDLHAVAPGNLAFDWGTGDWDATSVALDAAPYRVAVTLTTQRICGVPIEGRAALAEWDAAADRVTLTTTSQGVHMLQSQIAEHALHWPKERLRVVTPDVGGGFGPKFFAYPEQAALVWACDRLKRPICWVSGRNESFVSETHARPQETMAELGLDGDGRFLALRVTSRADMGAFLSTFGPGNPTDSMAKVSGGLYDLPNIALRTLGYYTSTVPVDAYRGAGKPPMVVALEAVVDRAAAHLGLSPVEIRRRNLIPADRLPYRTALGYTYDGGDYPAALQDALQQLDWDGFETRARQSADKGLLRGRGIACNMHPVGGVTTETASIHIQTSPDNPDDGRIVAWTGTQSTGQGHQTVFAQIVAERLGIDIDRIDIRQGDTDHLARGGGTGGSSSTAISGATLTRTADEIIRLARERAAEHLEAAESDLEFAAGAFTVAGTDRRVSLFTLSQDTPLDAATDFADQANTFPYGVVIAEVEIDPATGAVHLDRLGAVDDAGRVINPALLAGQSQGALAQGAGAVLLEQARYDADSGQLLTGSFMDYCMPRADDLPPIRTTYRETLSPTNIIGVRGIGELGSNGAPAAITNAIHDVLRAQGVDHLDPPFTAERVWRALQQR